MKRTKLDKQLLSDIVKTTDSIRKKYQQLKANKAGTEIQLEETFKPITEPLKEFVKKAKVLQEQDIKKQEFKEESSSARIKCKDEELKRDRVYEENEHIFETPKSKFNRKLNLTNTSSSSTKAVRQYVATPEGQEYLGEYLKQNHFSDIAKQYLDIYVNQPSVIDSIYTDDNDGNQWKIGNSDFAIDDNHIIVDEKSYIGSRGLYELLFMKYPDETIYSDDDLENYKSILLHSNAHRRSYDSSSQINGNRSFKYTRIISKLLNRKEGKGLTRTPNIKCKNPNLMETSNKQIDYIYWDDPNELVSRLRLLIASQQAGHNNHNNEIISIIEELKESQIIE